MYSTQGIMNEMFYENKYYIKRIQTQRDVCIFCLTA